MYKVMIIGARGYTGAELLPLLYRHGEFEVVAVGSTSTFGQPVNAHIGGLEGCLDHDQQGSLSTNLSDLYHYMILSLTQANIEDDIAKLNEISTLLIEIKSAWEQIPTLEQQVGA